MTLMTYWGRTNQSRSEVNPPKKRKKEKQANFKTQCLMARVIISLLSLLQGRNLIPVPLLACDLCPEAKILTELSHLCDKGYEGEKL